MAIQTTKVKNGTIVLPREIRKAWKGAEVFIMPSEDMLSIKRITPPSLSLTEMAREFRKAAHKAKITKKDVAEAIREVRKDLSK